VAHHRQIAFEIAPEKMENTDQSAANTLKLVHRHQIKCF